MWHSQPDGIGVDSPEHPAAIAASGKSFSPLQGMTLACAVAGIVVPVTLQLQPGDCMLVAMAAILSGWIAMDGLPRLARQFRERPSMTDMRGFALRIVTKLVGLATLCGVVGLAIAIFPFFRNLDAVVWFGSKEVLAAAPVFLVLVIAAGYIGLADRLSTEADDYLHQVGRAVLMQDFRLADALFALRLTIIKGFFLLLMFSAGMAGFAHLHQDPVWQMPFLSAHWFESVVGLVYLLDVVLAASGYVATLKLFDWHIRTTETTVLGWVACLACYEPFYGSLSAEFVPYGEGPGWQALFSERSAVFVIWSIAVLCLHLVYVWATIAFGPRFSNLTNRGIITSGPYRFTRHPAYLAKNLAWWMFSIPGFIASGLFEGLARAAMLALISLVYLLRARAEERMLLSDPAYQAYAAQIAAGGIFSRLFRLPWVALRN